jgi:hypothetical protein
MPAGTLSVDKVHFAVHVRCEGLVICATCLRIHAIRLDASAQIEATLHPVEVCAAADQSSSSQVPSMQAGTCTSPSLASKPLVLE